MSESNTRIIKVGSRKSQLALIQTNNVIKQLKEKHTNVDFDIITMTTTGDNILDRALSKIGEKNLFTRELEEALLDGRVDFVVHSLKDLPTTLPDGLAIGAVCKRDDPRDAVMFHPKHAKLTSLEDLPAGSVLGTSSLRRCAQLKRKYPSLKLKDIRGNLNTRLRKLTEAEDYDALILATAGLERMGWHDKISTRLAASEFMYAVGQGAMAVECRADDPEMLTFLTAISHQETVLPCVAERAFLKTLEGGCSTPVSVCANINKGDQLSLSGAVFSLDGSQGVIKDEVVTLEMDDDDARPNKSPRLSPPLYAAISASHVPPRALLQAQTLGETIAGRVVSAGGGALLSAAKSTIAAEIRQENEARQSKAENGANNGKA